MKNVTGIMILIVLVTFLFSACAADEIAVISETVPAEEILRTETEILHYEDSDTVFQTLELSYDSSNRLIRELQWEYRQDGTPADFSVTKYASDGHPVYYQRKSYEYDGALIYTFYKYYTDGNPVRIEEAYYWDGGNPYLVEKSAYSEDGALLKKESIGYYFANALAQSETQLREEGTQNLFVNRVSYHENGMMQSLCEGLFHSETGELLNGKIEDFDENGQLTNLEVVVWDAHSRTRQRTVTAYNGSLELSSHESRTFYSLSGMVSIYEHTAYGKNHAFAYSYVERYHYDEAENLTNKHTQQYLADGTPTESHTYTYTYDEGKLTALEHVFEKSPDKLHTTSLTEYTYHPNGSLYKEEMTVLNAAGVQQSGQIKEFDGFGNTTNFVTVSSQGNRHSYAYTYDEAGMVSTELHTIQYAYGTRIDYEETSYEYHENLTPRTVSVHKWTSNDEAKRPNAPKGDLGTTTVTEYDENGKKIKK